MNSSMRLRRSSLGDKAPTSENWVSGVGCLVKGNHSVACGWKQIHWFTENCAPALVTSILKIREKSVHNHSHSQTQKPLMPWSLTCAQAWK
jgi:hypothetical protein